MSEHGRDGRTLPWRMFDRTIRPFALSVSLATFVLTIGILLNATVGVSLNGPAGHFIAGASALTTALLWAGWWFRAMNLMTQGLLLAAGVWAAAGAAVLLSGDNWVTGLVALCWCVASAGSWLLEVNDPRHEEG